MVKVIFHTDHCRNKCANGNGNYCKKRTCISNVSVNAAQYTFIIPQNIITALNEFQMSSTVERRRSIIIMPADNIGKYF